MLVYFGILTVQLLTEKYSDLACEIEICIKKTGLSPNLVTSFPGSLRLYIYCSSSSAIFNVDSNPLAQSARHMKRGIYLFSP